MPVWWNGRRDGLKIRWWRHRVGSSPTTGTTSSRTAYRSRRRFLFQSKRHLSLIPSFLLSDRDSLRWIPVRIRKRKYPEWSYLTYERVLFFEHFPEKENSFCREPWYTKALTWNADEQKHPDGSRMTIPEALKNQCFRNRPLYINTSTCPNTNYFVNCDLLSIIFWIRFCQVKC